MRALVVAVLLGCAEREAPPVRTGNVDVPSWAEGSHPPRAVTLSPVTTPTSLGTDAPKRPAHGKKINLDVVATDLPNVCRLIGELAGVNIVVSDEVTGVVTIKVSAVPWDEALDAILLSRGYRTEQLGSVIVVRK